MSAASRREASRGGTSCSQRAAAVAGRGEYVNEIDSREPDLVEERERRLEVELGLSREAHDDVRRKGELRAASRAGARRGQRTPRACTGVSCGGGRSRSRTGRAGGGTTRRRASLPSRRSAFAEVLRVRGHEPEALRARQRTNRADEVGEVFARDGVAEGVHGLAQEFDLDDAFPEQAPALLDDVREAAVALPPARRRDDTERAVLVAAFDDRDRTRGAARAARSRRACRRPRPRRSRSRRAGRPPRARGGGRPGVPRCGRSRATKSMAGRRSRSDSPSCWATQPQTPRTSSGFSRLSFARRPMRS